jgi:hypothetical protein
MKIPEIPSLLLVIVTIVLYFLWPLRRHRKSYVEPIAPKKETVMG